MYNKGANILHTLRQLVEDDEKWRNIMRGLNKTFYHQTVTSKQIEDYISKETKIDLTEFFDQYLRDIRIPTLEYSINNNILKYRYINIVDKFDMPIQVNIDGKDQWIFPNAEWKSMPIKSNSILVDPDFYIETKKI